MITQCSIRHLYTLPTTTPAEKESKDLCIAAAKDAERRRCGHHELPEPLSELDCILSVVDPKGSGTNKNRYVVASQEHEVRRKMREVAGVPIVYLKRSVMILEPMSGRSEDVRNAEERGRIRAGLKGRRTPADSGLKRKREDEEESGRDVSVARPDGQADGDGEPQAKKQKKAKGPKGPNPLSVMKAKKEPSKKSAAQDVEEERAVLRKATKSDPQAAEKALDASTAVEDASKSITEGPRKRKRKRKATDDNGDDELVAATVAVAADD